MKSILLLLSLLLLPVLSAEPARAQATDSLAAAADSTLLPADAGAEPGILGSLWGVTNQAGGLQYPIYLVFVIGLFLIFAKIYELYTDQRESKELEAAPIPQMDLRRITLAVANQRDSMLARLQATMLNVFQTRQDATTLHDEIANFVQFQQDRFDTFRRRVDFLSDTAGALGLLGTVWGIFTVFSSETSDKQVILYGMGIALITTLLGLVASIILNLSSTEVFSFFNRRLDQISAKADELRFRLLELGADAEPTAAPAAVPAAASAPAPRRRAPVPEPVTAEAVAVSRDGQAPAPQPDPAPAPKPAAPPPPKPERLEVVELPAQGTVGTEATVRTRLLSDRGKPMQGQAVHLRIANGRATVSGEAEATVTTGSDGTAAFTLRLPEQSGRQELALSVPGSDAPETQATATIVTVAGAPEQVTQRGNNQGAVVGQALPKPLVVEVKDAFGNPVVDHPVVFSIQMGSGRFKDGGATCTVPTDAGGRASAHFVVGDEPGFNTVVAIVDDRQLSFQAMGLEG